jgi:hypothetical protein
MPVGPEAAVPRAGQSPLVLSGRRAGPYYPSFGDVIMTASFWFCDACRNDIEDNCGNDLQSQAIDVIDTWLDLACDEFWPCLVLDEAPSASRS